MSQHILKRLDDNPIADNSKHEIRAFVVAKNEMLRIPYFLKYYRENGVSRFFFVDNKSDDGSIDYLLEQPDCHVFLAESSYAKAQSGLRWSEQLLNQYGTGHWCLTLDVDEILVWPQSEDMSIPDLCMWLDHEGTEGIYTFMLDLYAKGAIADISYHPGADFLSATPYFDGDYKIRKRVRSAFWKAPAFPPKEAFGGPRLRTFFAHEKPYDLWLYRYLRHLYRQLCGRFVKKGWLKAHDSFLNPPILYKLPLVKWKADYKYLFSTHTMAPNIKLSSVSGVLLHFKFFSDFYEKIDYAVKSKEHFGGSAIYKRYGEMLEQSSGRLFDYDGTVKYTGTDDLTKRGYIETSDVFEDFIKNHRS